MTEKFVFAVTFNDFLIELSVAERRVRLINVRIRLARRVYLSQSENGAQRSITKFMDAAGTAFTPPGRLSARRGVAVPLLPAAIIIIEFPFDSCLLPCAPNYRAGRREVQVATISALAIERREYVNDSAPAKLKYVTQSSSCTGRV